MQPTAIEIKPDKPCAKCGQALPKYKVETPTGKVYYTSATLTYCNECKPNTAIQNAKKEACRLANRYPGLVKIIYECSCDQEKKSLHHYDYTRPYEVLKLCYPCHAKEHQRLILESNLCAANMIGK